MCALHLFPEILSDSRMDNYLILLQSLKDKTSLTFKFRPKTQLSPAGHAILACLCDRAVEQQAQIDWEIPQRTRKKINFLSQLQNILKNSTHLPLPAAYNFETKTLLVAGNLNALDLGFIEKFDAKFPLPDDLAFDCHLILQELMHNTITHSGAERYFIYAGLWHYEIHLGVLDMGVTIPARLRQKYLQSNDVNYILLALEEGVTTRRQRIGGLGLYYFCHFLKKNKGKLTIVSGQGQVRHYFFTRKSQKSPLKYCLPGTWCFARIPLGGYARRLL